MPLTAQVSKSTFSFPSLELPYLSTDFDFETVKHFERGDKPETKEVNKLIAKLGNPVANDPTWTGDMLVVIYELVAKDYKDVVAFV